MGIRCGNGVRLAATAAGFALLLVVADPQPPADPDVHDLVELGDGIRRYREGLCKSLVEGRWIATLADDSATSSG